jgi:hypothetical protein
VAAPVRAATKWAQAELTASEVVEAVVKLLPAEMVVTESL